MRHVYLLRNFFYEYQATTQAMSRYPATPQLKRWSLKPSRRFPKLYNVTGWFPHQVYNVRVESFWHNLCYNSTSLTIVAPLTNFYDVLDRWFLLLFLISSLLQVMYRDIYFGTYALRSLQYASKNIFLSPTIITVTASFSVNSSTLTLDTTTIS